MERVTLESLTEVINHIRGQLTTVRGSMSRMEDRLIDVEDSFNYTITPETVHQFLKSTPINQNEYVPKGYTRLYNVDQRRQVLRIKVEICGALGFDLVLDDWYNQNYITSSMVAYLRLPRLSRHYPYIMEGCKVT
ncbi:hypothetical protein KY289_016712 [Solanum tuberosum]|nr:hypothetical protein KY289_016712 [Solanum tuberosum]